MPDYKPRRRWPRQAVTVECRIEGVSNRASVRLSELSFGGGYVDTTAVFAAGDPVNLILVLDGAEAMVSGRVVYTHAGMGFGFAFDIDQLPHPARQQIEDFLRRSGLAETNHG